jgi:hypothetical protein
MTVRPRGDWSPVLYRGSPSSVPGMTYVGFATECYWDRLFLTELRFPVIVPPLLCTGARGSVVGSGSMLQAGR